MEYLILQMNYKDNTKTIYNIKFSAKIEIVSNGIKFKFVSFNNNTWSPSSYTTKEQKIIKNTQKLSDEIIMTEIKLEIVPFLNFIKYFRIKTTFEYIISLFYHSEDATELTISKPNNASITNKINIFWNLFLNMLQIYNQSEANPLPANPLPANCSGTFLLNPDYQSQIDIEKLKAKANRLQSLLRKANENATAIQMGQKIKESQIQHHGSPKQRYNF
jgi:hypothetical protein